MMSRFLLRPSSLLLTVLLLIQCGTLSAETPSALIRSVPIASQSLTETLRAFGTLEPDPDQILSLSLPHAGLVNRIWVRLGQRVKRGDPLLEIITSPDARMAYLQALSAVDFATRDVQRQERLLEEQLATKAQVDAARKNLQDAQAKLSALKKRGQDSTEETLRAPMDGILTRLDVSQGQRVQADTTALLIAAEQRLIARLGLEPEDLKHIQPNASVSIRSVFVPEIQIATQIREIHAMIDPATHLVEALAPIPEAQIDHLILGSRIIAQIEIKTQTALVVPRSAVLNDAQGAYIFVVAQGKAKKIHVEEGIETQQKIAISSPQLQAGDSVVISGNYELSDGMSVREAP